MSILPSMRAIVLILPTLAVAACASSETQYLQNLENIGLAGGTDAEGKARDLFRRIGAEPTNAQLHYDNGRFLLARGSHSDLQVALVAFTNASRFAPDAWLPELGVAAVEYRLGRYDASLAAIVEAVERRDECGTLCYGLAFVAYRSGRFGLAANALAAAKRAGPPSNEPERTAATFLEAALAEGPRSHSAKRLTARLHPKGTVSPPQEDGNVSIAAYAIRQNRGSSSSQGVNLLEALQIQFGATLVNWNYTRETGQDVTTQIERNVEVTVPTVTYALNIASEDQSRFSIEASPTVVAAAGETSRFFQGSNVLIIPDGDDRDSVERDIGIDLKVTPKEITKDNVHIEAALELTNIGTQSVEGVSATVLQTDKTLAEATARVPYGRAMAVGAAAFMTTRGSGNGVPGIRSLPVLGRLFGTESASVSRDDVLVLIAVQEGVPTGMPPPIDEAAISKRLFDVPPAEVSRVSRLPSQAPAIKFLDWL